MSGAVVAPTSMQKATAAAAAVKAKAKAAFEKIKPKFGERITIAGEPVYLDMPEDSKVHADRIYLKKHYLHEDAITENTKEVYRRFTAEKKVASCEKVHLDILQKGLSYRLQTVEAEAADLSEKRGNSVPLRQKLGHAQGLRDLLEVVKGEVLLCANKEAAATRRKAEEDAAAAAAALDNKPREIEENQIQTLVKKFAVLILHASDPIDEDRPRLNKPAKNLIARLDAAPLLEGKGLETFIDNHIHKESSPLLMRILAMGEEGLEEHDNFYKTLFYADLLNEIRRTLDDKFTQDLPKDDPPQETIRKIINSILHFYHAEEQRVTELNTEATGLQTRIDQLRAELGAVKRGADDKREGDADENQRLIAQLATETAKLAGVQAELEVKKNDAAKCESGLAAVTAAATSKGIIDGLQRDAEAAKAAVSAAAAAAEEIKGQLAAKDAELIDLREQLRKCNEEELVAARSAGATEAGAAAAARAELVAEKARLEGQITSVTAERDSFKRQQAEEAGKVLARNAELVTTQASVAALQAQIVKFNKDAAEAAEATQKRIAEFEGKLGDKDAAAVAMGDEFRRQLDAAQAAAARGLAEQLRDKDAENTVAIQLAREALDDSKRQLEEVKKAIVASRAAKNQVNAKLGTVEKALKNKTTEYTTNLAAKEAQLLAATEKAAVDLKAAKEAAALDKQMVVDAAAVALGAKTAELEGSIRDATVRVSQIQAEAAAAAAAAKAASDKEIAGLQTVQLKLRAEAAAMQANLRQAGADTKAAKEATAALEATNKEIAAILAAMTASKAKCDADAAAAAATAKTQIGNLTAQFRRQEEAAKHQGAQHAAALEKLRADHAVALAAATAKAAADAKTAFDKRVADLGGEKSAQIAAAETAAREAAGKQLAAELAKASAERQAAVTGARAEGRVAAVKEKDDAIAALKQEGVAKEAAAVETAVKAAKAEFVQREAQLAAERDAAVAAAKKKVTAEKKAELEGALAAAAVAATAATAAAVAASRDSVMTAAAAELTAEKDRSRAAADAARKEGSAAARADDLEKLKDFAAKVLAGQAKAAEYAGDANKPLANILGKLDAMGSASSNDICALVYFVSYFLNTMIKPNLLKQQYMLPSLIENIKSAINQTAPKSKDLFNLIMAIQPSLLLANKILPRGGSESSTDTMNYFITQTPTTEILTTLFRFKSKLQNDVAWRTVRGEKGTSTSMCFYLNKSDNRKITLLYRPKTTDTATVNKQRRLLRTYGVDGILEFAPRATTTAELAEITALEKLNEDNYITYEVLFLIFLYASKQYIVNNRASIACTVPMEIINNIVLENPMAEQKGQAVAPAALTIRVPEAPTYAEVVVGSPPSSPGPPGPPPASAARQPKPPVTAEQRAALVAANVAAQMAAAEALRPAKASLPSPASLPSSEAVARGGPGQWAQQRAQGAEAAKGAEPALRLESLSAPPSPLASAPGSPAQSKCVPTPISRVPNPPPQGRFYDIIILSPRLVEIFSKDPFCFTGLQDRVELDYRQFKDALDGVINRFCSGENPTKLMIPPGFIQDKDTKKLVPTVACSLVGAKRTQLCNLSDVTGSSMLEFVCLNQCSKLTPVKTTQPTMGNGPKRESGIVLGTTIAAGLKSQPFCIDVQGVASITSNNPVYDSASLFSVINNTKAAAAGVLPRGFIRDAATKTIKIDTKIGAWNVQGFYFVDGRTRGGRRTQKKKRNSKKFTQRKR